MTSPFFSIIIPVRQTTDYLRQTLTKLKEQSYKNFEVIVITDKDVPNHSDPIQLAPAYKRNLGASKSKGDYLAFLDDDSYPHPDWLQNCANQIKNQPKLAGLCGPCLTPPHDNIFQQASGLVWSSFIGSGGAGVYRNSIKPARYVDDYPSVNLIIKKSIFDQIGGFQTDFWPGEDTILCLEITHTLGQKILYHPDIIVYHHRRQVIIPHLQQITRYALHRGHFARIYPKTSFRLGYLIPSLFLLYNLFLILFLTFNRLLLTDHIFLYLLLFPNLLYLFLLLLNALYFLFIFHISYLILLLFIITVPITHLYYGFLFIRGFFTPHLDLKPHSTDNKTGNYLGG